MANPNEVEEAPMPPEFRLAEIMWKATATRSTWFDVIKAASSGNIEALRIREAILTTARAVIEAGWTECTHD
jgi:hypothetical protein